MGIYDLQEEITKDFPLEEEAIDDNIKFSLIGRPNVGKS